MRKTSGSQVHGPITATSVRNEDTVHGIKSADNSYKALSQIRELLPTGKQYFVMFSRYKGSFEFLPVPLHYLRLA